jgi:hypothetical protein
MLGNTVCFLLAIDFLSRLSGAMLRIWDAYPGSDLFPLRIQDWQDPGSGSASNNFSIFNPNEIRMFIPDPVFWLWISFHPGSRIQWSRKPLIPDPGVKKAPDPQHRTQCKECSGPVIYTTTCFSVFLYI